MGFHKNVFESKGNSRNAKVAAAVLGKLPELPTDADYDKHWAENLSYGSRKTARKMVTKRMSISQADSPTEVALSEKQQRQLRATQQRGLKRYTRTQRQEQRRLGKTQAAAGEPGPDEEDAEAAAPLEVPATGSKKAQRKDRKRKAQIERDPDPVPEDAPPMEVYQDTFLKLLVTAIDARHEAHDKNTCIPCAYTAYRRQRHGILPEDVVRPGFEKRMWKCFFRYHGKDMVGGVAGGLGEWEGSKGVVKGARKVEVDILDVFERRGEGVGSERMLRGKPSARWERGRLISYVAKPEWKGGEEV